MGAEIAIDELNNKYDGEYNFELVIADKILHIDFFEPSSTNFLFV